VTRRVPLFPLGTVLFPGLLLPLHVFEQRYRDLVEDLLRADESERALGVVAIREGREVGADSLRALHPVGCLARLRRVDRYDDGRFDLVTMGTTRFRLVEVDRDRTAYLQGSVEPLPEPAGADPRSAAVAVRELFAAYGDRLGVTVDDLPTDPDALGYQVSATVVLDLSERQALLEAPDATTRLRELARLLRREIGLLGTLPSLPGVDLTRAPASPN
jgi:Lon protease-like protein